MPSLKDNLNDALKASMKKGEATRVSTFRMLKSEIKNKEIELGKPLVDADVVKIIQKRVKMHKESIVQFEKGGREDLANKEKEELAILAPYLPSLISGAELEQKVYAILDKAGVNSPKQMGQAMQAISKELSGQADMKEVSALVRKKLS